MRKPIVPAIGIVAVLIVARIATAFSGDLHTEITVPTPTVTAVATITLALGVQSPVLPTSTATPAFGRATKPRPSPNASLSTSRPSSAATVNSINGVPISRIAVIPDAVAKHIRQVWAAGQSLGRNPRAFSKVGDSTMAYPPFLAAFGRSYKLAQFNYLQPTIERFSGSFGRTSVAVRKGMHTWSEFDPGWVDSKQCRSGEGPLVCELRLNDPSIVIIRLGANDYYAPKLFEEQLRKIVDVCLARGAIPVLGTKPDRMEGAANTLNQIVGKVASAYEIPLWDYDLLAQTVPGKGLQPDHVHMRGGGTHDYSLPQAFSSADSLEDLSALVVLDAIRRAVAP